MTNDYAVAKFGGTSIQNVGAIRQAASIAIDNPKIRVLVVSAVGGVTNMLVEWCVANHEMRARLARRLHDVHMCLVNELSLDIEQDVYKIINRLNTLISLDVLTAEEMDYVLSIGEDLSSMILHAYLVKEGIKAKYLDAREYMITDDHFGKATPNLAAIGKFKFPEQLCVTQGFIGITQEGRTTTLGRGGSDFSAALIAEAIGASDLLIYTDVMGICNVDPNVVPEANLVPEINFRDMYEMANLGAKVLHPDAIPPCARANICMHILSASRPGELGTRISPMNDDVTISKITAITMRANQVLVTIRNMRSWNQCCFLAKVFELLAKYKVNIDLITTTEASVALTVDGTNIGSHSINPFIANQAMLDELAAFSMVDIEKDLTLLAVVGAGLAAAGVIQKTLAAIDSCAIRMMSYGASSTSVGILVHKDHAINIARSLHKELFGCA